VSQFSSPVAWLAGVLALSLGCSRNVAGDASAGGQAGARAAAAAAGSSAEAAGAGGAGGATVATGRTEPSAGSGGELGGGGAAGAAEAGGPADVPEIVSAPGNCVGHSDVDFRLVGWATQDGGTTGGAGGDTITVTNGADLQQALTDKQDSTTPLTIMVAGTITEANSGIDKIDIKDVTDVSVIGVDDGAEFDGIGIKLMRASNIVVRNLRIHHVQIGDQDCISIEGPVDHVWIDHCELYNDYDGVEKDDYDGLLDAKAESEYITYSWNYLHDSWKTGLVGSSEEDAYDRKITMHHNYYRNCYSRVPLFRGGNGHVFNNYFQDIHSTTINSRVGACLRIENNYFSAARNPWVSAYSGVLGGGEPVCNQLVDSVFDYSGEDVSELPECTSTIPYRYAAVLNEASVVPDIVPEHAGVGKLADPTSF